MEWSTADIVIFAVAAYLAVVTLVRLMRARRDQLVRQVHQRMQVEKRQPKQSDGDAKPHEDAA